jgi:hypothetical protein
LLGLKLDTISSRDALPRRKVNVRCEFTADKPGEFGASGTSCFIYVMLGDVLTNPFRLAFECSISL